MVNEHKLTAFTSAMGTAFTEVRISLATAPQMLSFAWRLLSLDSIEDSAARRAGYSLPHITESRLQMSPLHVNILPQYPQNFQLLRNEPGDPIMQQVGEQKPVQDQARLDACPFSVKSKQ